ncbi:conserved hypothetical protein [Ricinus communis]|uniref:Uncharacterized protein n=1 Tax=Ricinus communis TaxID=3988 RepID=B9R8B5_RICCO|nr:conserved hypothetical protein [Ricinus communis]
MFGDCDELELGFAIKVPNGAMLVLDLTISIVPQLSLCFRGCFKFAGFEKL